MKQLILLEIDVADEPEVEADELALAIETLYQDVKSVRGIRITEEDVKDFKLNNLLI